MPPEPDSRLTRHRQENPAPPELGPYIFIPQPREAARVLIAYSDRTQFRSLRFLKRGFRHCLTLRQIGDCWVLVDGLSNQLVLSVMDTRGLVAYLHLLCRDGWRVQVTWTNANPPARFTLMPGTCVEIAKRVLGIVSWRVWTPHQLFMFIKRNILTTYDG